MQEIKVINLDYLNNDEIMDFYELFFGKILIKKQNFSYYDNLSKSLSRGNFIQQVIDRLNDDEVSILKLLSALRVIIPRYNIVKKISIILDISKPIVSKSINNLIDKKYIFSRDEETLVIPNIYFDEPKEKINFVKIDDELEKVYYSKACTDFNNLINFFVSKEFKISNSLELYKKDLELTKRVFSKYSSIKDYNLIANFFSIVFSNNEGQVNIEVVKAFFELTQLERVLFFIKVVFPWAYSIITFFREKKTSVSINIDDFKKLWIKLFLLSEYKVQPINMNFKDTLKLFELLKLINIDKDGVVIPFYEDMGSIVNGGIKINSSFNIYINADTSGKDYYFLSLFSDLLKYNKIVEYEISELSIKRCAINGILINNIIDFIKNNGIVFPNNVETTVRQWFNKHTSFFYTHGTVFFAETKEKGRLIQSIAKNGLVNVFEIKENEIFLIPDEHKDKFFMFLDKSGIDFYYKTPKKYNEKNDYKTLDVSEYFDN